MREIKFRGWYDKEKRWVYGFYVDKSYWTEPDRDGNERHRSYHAIYADDGFYSVHEHTIGQFTGLHDKNGKEIYEGDMLKSNTWACDCEVVWMDGGFTLKEGETSYNLKANFSDGDGYYLDDIEVIGNIHEATP